MKKVLKRIILVVLLVPILLIVISFFLPSKYRVERSEVIQAPPEAIYPRLAQLKRWPEWTVWNTNFDSTLVYTFTGPAEGAGAEMSWTAKSGNGALKLTGADPRSGVTYELNFEQGKFLARGGVMLTPAEGGATRTTWFNEGDLGWNPVWRYFGLLMDRMMGGEFQKNLDSLKAKTEGKG